MTGDDGQIDTYLGRVFDGLAGNGAAGRRALVEIEDHLRCAVDEYQAAGMSRAQAEAAAIERLGPPDRVVSGLRAEFVLPWPTVLARLIGGTWLLGALALVCVGLSGVLAAGAGALWGKSAIAADPPTATYSTARCAYLLEYYPQPDGDCRAASIAHHYQEGIEYRLAGGVVGTFALAGWFVARRGRLRGLRRLTGLTRTPPPIVMTTVAMTTAGLAVFVMLGQGIDAFAIERPWGAWATIADGIATAPVFAYAAVRLTRELRRQPAH